MTDRECLTAIKIGQMGDFAAVQWCRAQGFTAETEQGRETLDKFLMMLFANGAWGAMHEVEKAFCYELAPIDEQHTDEQHTRELKELMNLMPENFRTEQAYKVFGKAIEKGLITKSDNNFSWKKSNVLLCFMFGRLYCGDYTFESKFNNGKPLWKKGANMLFPESFIEEVFRIKNTSQSRKQASSVPNGYSVVEDFFKAV